MKNQQPHSSTPEVILSREDILSVQDRSIEKIEVPEWKGYVHVRSLTGFERDRYETSLMVGTGKKQRVTLENARAKLCALTLCDQTGQNLLFSESDVIALGRKNAGALQRIFEKAQELSGLTEEDIEEMTENLGGTDGAGSGSN